MPTKEKKASGEKILCDGETKTCCLCGTEFTEWGNNPEPIKSFEEGKCCNWCNEKYVIPTRIRNLFEPRA